ncbi:Gfo/Idh/MocA family oxidoreductase [Conexibacter stalactiti]|uniref:Gfo/Idh/MocA family oxidoreductase n=1 Tax=Conexibacter stalactiti TaxID=1940611 RepID=A0ABU4HQV4_9ACTN|nr:Gfo/Idh/MocA family oxidoreductase [Conexibacter stalactiti]MDW5595614.1 Gfo/Idh/MocA family oxidoreductase [Conexibacter stalactiti]MEC5036256.1 Gfo/Idh/MocA family oxidoreductase [Conexibacter stalactiti]
MALSAAVAGVRHPHVFVRVQQLRAREDVSLLGFHEPDAEIAARFAHETGLTRFASLDALLEQRPDLLVSEALDTQVPDVALAAAPHVRALLLEKPGAPTLAEMERLVAGLAAYPIDAHVGYQLHYSPSIARMRALLESGALGQVTLARFNAGCPIGCGDELWQSVPGDLGGVMFTEGCHMLQLIVDALGVPQEVSGMIERLPAGTAVRSNVVKRDLFDDPAPEDESAVGRLMYEDVGAALLRYPTLLATLDVTAWEATDWVHNWILEFQGTNGTLKVRPLPPRLDLFLRTPAGGLDAGDHVEQWESPAGHELTLVPDPAYERQLDAVLDRLRSDEQRSAPSQTSLRQARDVIRVLDAIYRSSARRATVALPRHRQDQETTTA